MVVVVGESSMELLKKFSHEFFSSGKTLYFWFIKLKFVLFLLRQYNKSETVAWQLTSDGVENNQGSPWYENKSKFLREFFLLKNSPYICLNKGSIIMSRVDTNHKDKPFFEFFCYVNWSECDAYYQELNLPLYHWTHNSLYGLSYDNQLVKLVLTSNVNLLWLAVEPSLSSYPVLDTSVENQFIVL